MMVGTIMSPHECCALRGTRRTRLLVRAAFVTGVTEQHSSLLRSVLKTTWHPFVLHSSLLSGDSSSTRLLILYSGIIFGWYFLWCWESVSTCQTCLLVKCWMEKFNTAWAKIWLRRCLRQVWEQVNSASDGDVEYEVATNGSVVLGSKMITMTTLTKEARGPFAHSMLENTWNSQNLRLMVVKVWFSAYSKPDILTKIRLGAGKPCSCTHDDGIRYVPTVSESLEFKRRASIDRVREKNRFRFGDDDTRMSLWSAVIPIKRCETSVLWEGCSVLDLQRMEVVLDLEKGQVTFNKLGVTLNLEESATGHYVIDLICGCAGSNQRGKMKATLGNVLGTNLGKMKTQSKPVGPRIGLVRPRVSLVVIVRNLAADGRLEILWVTTAFLWSRMIVAKISMWCPGLVARSLREELLIQKSCQKSWRWAECKSLQPRILAIGRKHSISGRTGILFSEVRCSTPGLCGTASFLSWFCNCSSP